MRGFWVEHLSGSIPDLLGLSVLGFFVTDSCGSGSGRVRDRLP